MYAQVVSQPTAAEFTELDTHEPIAEFDNCEPIEKWAQEIHKKRTSTPMGCMVPIELTQKNADDLLEDLVLGKIKVDNQMHRRCVIQMVEGIKKATMLGRRTSYFFP